MTLEETIRLYRRLSATSPIIYQPNSKTLGQIATWLEELKWIKATNLYTQAQVDLFKQESYNKALDDLLEKMNPCAICSSYPNECNNKRYFENCYVAENNMSYEKLRQTIEKLRKGIE